MNNVLGIMLALALMLILEWHALRGTDFQHFLWTASLTLTVAPLLDRLPVGRRLETGPLLGRSLAMGGLSMASLVLSLSAGQSGLHLAASPEGPYYAIDFSGGAPVQP